MSGGLVRIGNRRVQRFVTPPQEVRDGTVRCIACGQIDEAPYHDDALCPATRPQSLPADVDHEAVCSHADSSNDPLAAMLRDADERLGRPTPDVLGARIGIHAARLAVSSRILDEIQDKATGALAVNFPGIAVGEQLTTPRLAELTDYATAYDAFSAETPDGATDGVTTSPMNPARRFQVVALQELLGHRRADPSYHARQIAEQLDEGDGFWKACSGCQEGEDGHVSQTDYPFNPVFRCQPGGGCSECGGLGVLWDDTDYEAMAQAMLADEQADEQAGGTGDLDLYDPIAQRAISWTLNQVGRQLGAVEWAEGDGSESVEGDVAAEIHNIMRAAGLVDAEGEPLRKDTIGSLCESAAAPTRANPFQWANDPVQGWLAASCLTGPACTPDARELARDLHKSYCAWCAENGVDRPLLIAPFGTALTHYEILPKGKNNRGLYWRGPVKLKVSDHD